MAEYEVSVCKYIPQAPEKIYALIADYHSGHPLILPRPPFEAFSVLKGGLGEGTEIRFQIRQLGMLRTVDAVISEPEPGRLLAENQPASGIVTVFIVDPLENHHGAEVTIASCIPLRTGILGRLEAWLTKRALRQVYQRELELLDRALAA